MVDVAGGAVVDVAAGAVVVEATVVVVAVETPGRGTVVLPSMLEVLAHGVPGLMMSEVEYRVVLHAFAHGLGLGGTE